MENMRTMTTKSRNKEIETILKKTNGTSGVEKCNNQNENCIDESPANLRIQKKELVNLKTDQ